VDEKNIFFFFNLEEHILKRKVCSTESDSGVKSQHLMKQRIAAKFETAKVMLFQSQCYRGNCFSSKTTGMM